MLDNKYLLSTQGTGGNVEKSKTLWGVPKNTSEDGFTLIELLIVILIIGILAAIVTVSLSGAIADARAKACSQDAGNLQSTLAHYQLSPFGGKGEVLPATGTSATNQVIPTQTSDLTTTYSWVTYTFADLDILTPSFISKVPGGSGAYPTEVTAYLVSAKNGVTLSNKIVIVAPTSDSKCQPAGM